MEERVSKIMAQAGIASRRASDKLIEQGRVTVNGAVVALGAKADPGADDIAVDGKLLKRSEKLVYVMLNKPAGVLSAPDVQGGDRKTVFDLVNLRERLFVVGRLDVDSEGLILMTNDGDLAHKLTHPRYEHTKIYRVQIKGQPDEAALQKWRSGVELDGEMTAPAKVTVARKGTKQSWLYVVMREGRKRQIRRVADLLGYRVQRLKRIRIGTLKLQGVEPGRWRFLTSQEVRDLKKLAKQGRHTRQRR